LMHVYIYYPDHESEQKILRLVRGGEDKEKGKKKAGIKIAQDSVFTAREQIHEVHVSQGIEKYIVDLINATRQPEKYSEELKKWLDVGASPRGSLALDKCARVHAWFNGRDHVTPDDIRAIVHDALRHRIILSYEANAEGISANQVIRELVKLVAIP